MIDRDDSSTDGERESGQNIAKLWRQYERARSYNESIGLYEQVRRNEDFYVGKQWEGVRAGNLDKPVFNILRRVVSYFISQIVSDDVSASFTPHFGGREEDAKTLAREVDRVIERTGLKALCREIVRSAAVEGDSAIYFRFDPDLPTGQAAAGDIVAEVIPSERIMFGNPYDDDIEEQPYILIAMRQPVEQVRRYAEANGVSADDARGIVADMSEMGDDEEGVVTEVVRLSLSGTVRAVIYTEHCIVRPEWDTGLTRYPVAMLPWEQQRGSYHGVSPITALIPNQIFINKLFAMAMQSVKLTAFPKIFYNKNSIGEWSNKLDDAVGVTGDPNGQIFAGWRAPDMSAQVIALIEKTIQYTKDFMGASDAALGNGRTDNTSAIIAMQKASAAPLELQRLGYYKFVEDSVRVIVDMMRTYYGRRYVPTRDSGEAAPQPPLDMGALMGGGSQLEQMQQPEQVQQPTQVLFDFGGIEDLALALKVDVGAASYWSELTQIQTLDNLFAKGIITDAVTYLEGIPDAYVHGKNRILQKLRERQAAEDEIAAIEQQAAAISAAPPQM